MYRRYVSLQHWRVFKYEEYELKYDIIYIISIIIIYIIFYFINTQNHRYHMHLQCLLYHLAFQILSVYTYLNSDTFD